MLIPLNCLKGEAKAEESPFATVHAPYFHIIHLSSLAFSLSLLLQHSFLPINNGSSSQPQHQFCFCISFLATLSHSLLSRCPNHLSVLCFTTSTTTHLSHSPSQVDLPPLHMLTLSGKVSKEVRTASLEPNLEALKRLMMSCRVAATMKYSCFRRSSFPSKKLSLGYSTREMFSAKLRSSTAWM